MQSDSARVHGGVPAKRTSHAIDITDAVRQSLREPSTDFIQVELEWHLDPSSPFPSPIPTREASLDPTLAAHAFVARLILAAQVTPDQLVARLGARQGFTAEDVRGVIASKLARPNSAAAADADVVIATRTIRSSLICPVQYM